MNGTKFFLTVSILLCFPIFSANAESLRYEKVFDQVSFPDSHLIFSVDNTGYATLHAPAFMVFAGQHEWYLSKADMDSLWKTIKPESIPNVDTDAIKERLAQRVDDELVAISGTDITYLQWQTGGGTNVNRVQISALYGWRTMLPGDEELERLAAAESRIWSVIKKLVNDRGEL